MSSIPAKNARTRCLRIGVVAPEFPPTMGGTAQHALGLSKALARTDRIILFTQPSSQVTADDPPGFPVHRVLTRRVGRDAKILKQAEVDVWLLLNAGYAPLTQVLRAPTFVYCHGNDFLFPWVYNQSETADRIGNLMSKAPVAWRWAAGFRNWTRQRHLGRGLEQARHVFTNSRFTLANLMASFPRCRIDATVSNPGIDPELLIDDVALTARQARRRPGLHLISIANLSSFAPQKRIDETLRALAELCDSDVAFTIIGDGDDRTRLENLARELNIANRVRFLGTVTNSSIMHQLDDSDLFVLVSREGFGMVYVEAAARGVPSLACAEQCATDAFVPGKTAILVPAPTSREIAHGIRRFAAEHKSFDPFEIRRFAMRFLWPEIAKSLRAEITHRIDQDVA